MFIRAAEHSTLLFGIFGDYRMLSMVLKISEFFNIMKNNSKNKKRSGRIFSNNNERKKPKKYYECIVPRKSSFLWGHNIFAISITKPDLALTL